MDLGVLALHPLLEEAPLLDVVDVHVFEADVAAVIGLKHATIWRTVACLEAERAADPDRPVEIASAEAVIVGREVGRNVAPREAERIEVGGEVAAHAIGADQHHRADAVVGGAADLVGAGARGSGLLGDRRLALSRSSPASDRGRGSARRAPRPASSAAPSSGPASRSTNPTASFNSLVRARLMPQPAAPSASCPAQMGLG